MVCELYHNKVTFNNPIQMSFWPELVEKTGGAREDGAEEITQNATWSYKEGMDLARSTKAGSGASNPHVIRMPEKVNKWI